MLPLKRLERVPRRRDVRDNEGVPKRLSVARYPDQNVHASPAALPPRRLGMFRTFDLHTTPTIVAGASEPLDTVFHDPAYPGFFCGECSNCHEKLFAFSQAVVRTYLKDHEHVATAAAASVPVGTEQPSLF